MGKERNVWGVEDRGEYGKGKRRKMRTKKCKEQGKHGRVTRRGRAIL